MLIRLRQRNIMLTSRANEIIEKAAVTLVKEIGHQIYPDGSIKSFERDVEVETNYDCGAICWQCSWFKFGDQAISEFIQAFSKNGPINFSYLALKRGDGEIITESLWSDAEIESSEANFAFDCQLEAS